jgi:3-(3-hydroxy-phenyl)propionate hydroxylase
MLDGGAPQFEVAIVGLGPAGSMLANLLGRAGITVGVFERDEQIHALPRAVHFDGEIMRVFQSAGLAREMEAVARPSSKGMHFVDENGETLMVRRGVTGPGPHFWPNNWYFHQPKLDAVLRSGLTRFAQVEVHLGHEVREVRDEGQFVSLSVEDRRSNSLREVTARYVVGCDGAHSMVRSTIGTQMEDLGLHQPWLVVDVVAHADSKRAGLLPDYTVQTCDPRRPMTRVHVGNDRHRWEIMLMPGDSPDAIVEPHHFWSFVQDVLRPDDGRIERAAVYTFHALNAQAWSAGRLLLAGDSCHQTPPFLGQGMCAGIRDASNLAWKLRLVLRGEAAPSLLETYGTERRQHVRTFIDLAVRLGGVITATEPAEVDARNQQFRAGSPHMFDFPQPQLGVGLRGDQAPPVGVIFPQPRLGDGRLLDEHAGDKFCVLVDSEILGPLDQHVKDGCARYGVTVCQDVGPQVKGWLREHSVGAVMLRPDRYVFAVTQTVSQLGEAINVLAQSLWPDTAD